MGDFQSGLHAFDDHPLVGNARGVGLIGALEVVSNKETKEVFDSAWGVAAHVGERALKHGLITRALGDTVNFCPPMIITKAEIADMYARARLALDETYAWLQASRPGAAA
jgi:4-aminobutyrate--pyruvate transaminase